MTDNYELVGSIRRSLADITSHWDAMLVAPSGGGRPGAASARITLDDHDERESDLDRSTRVVSLRREVLDVLNAISRWVMEDRPVTKALPDGSDVTAMATFIDRHAEWIADLDAQDNGYEAGRLKDLAKKVTNLVVPPRKEWHYLGDCPFVVEDWFCAGRVRVPIGGDETDATCSDCGQKASVRWWELVLGMDEEIVDAQGMASAIFSSLHIRVTERTVRNWARQERITRFVPFGPQLKEPRYWFAVRSVLDEVARMDQECPVCGGIFSGEGRVCTSCWYTIQNASRRYAEPKRPTPAARSLRPVRVVPDSHDTDRPERCHFSDLPLDQCACGRPHVTRAC